jgi:hypothetical protein
MFQEPSPCVTEITHSVRGPLLVQDTFAQALGWCSQQSFVRPSARRAGPAGNDRSMLLVGLLVLFQLASVSI